VWVGNHQDCRETCVAQNMAGLGEKDSKGKFNPVEYWNQGILIPGALNWNQGQSLKSQAFERFLKKPKWE